MYALVAAAGLLGLLLTPAFGCAGAPSHERKETAAPEPPREYVETALVPSSGHTIRVRDGDDLQDAIDVAQLGDTIVVEAGATFKARSRAALRVPAGWTARASADVAVRIPGER